MRDRKAAPKSLFWAPDGLDELLEVHFEFPFILIGKLTLGFFYRLIRDWSKSIGEGGPEQRGGGSWGFEPCARGGSCNFQLPLGGGSPYFLLTTNETVDYTCYIKHSQLELLLKYSQTCCARKYKG